MMMMVLSADARVPGTETGGTDNPSTGVWGSGDLVIWRFGDLVNYDRAFPMTPRVFTAGWLVAAAVLSSWAVASASNQPRPQPVAASLPAEPLPDLSMDIQAEIARLSARLQVSAAPAAPGRDPFRFGTRRGTQRNNVSGAARTGLAGATTVSEFSSPSVSSEGERSSREVVALPDAASVPTLSGVAELSAGALTAVINLAGELHYVRKGDVIAGRFRIDAIAFDGADVFDLVLGTISRLKLQL